MLELVVSNLHQEMPQRTDYRANASKWTLWVALRGFANEHTATFIEKVVYELHPTFKQRFVTVHPPFFSLCRCGWTAFTVRCHIHWNAMLGMPPMQVDHKLVFEPHGNQTTNLAEIDPVAMQTVGLDVVQRIPNSAPQQEPAIGLHPRAFGALALDVPQREAASNSRAKLPSKCTPQWLPPGDCHSFEVVVGNHHKCLSEEAVGDLLHEWTMYVMLPEFQKSKWRMIECVVYNLHPLCSPATYTKRSPKLELTSLSRESFSITCNIHWNPALGLQPTAVVHDLVFAEGGGHTSTTVGVSTRRLQFFA